MRRDAYDDGGRFLLKILAVDTDRSALLTLTHCLCSMYPDDEIKPFFDPLLAVQYAFHHEVNAVYTEIAMKGLNGFELMRLIGSKQTSPVLFVFVTETNDYRAAARCFMADGYTLKPVNREKLLSDGGRCNERRK